MAKCWLRAYIARATVPVFANNRDQCLAVRHVLVARALVPVCGNNRDRASHEPGPLPIPNEPGPLPGIGPSSEMNRERCLFWAGRKGGLSTSVRLVIKLFPEIVIYTRSVILPSKWFSV